MTVRRPLTERVVSALFLATGRGDLEPYAVSQAPGRLTYRSSGAVITAGTPQVLEICDDEESVRITIEVLA